MAENFEAGVITRALSDQTGTPGYARLEVSRLPLSCTGCCRLFVAKKC